MIRTRDFLLFLLSAGFLVLAITVTVTTRSGLMSERDFVPGGPIEDKEYGVEISDPETVDREARILALREHIASMNDETISAPESDIVAPETLEENEEDTDEQATTSPEEPAGIQLCSSYSESTVWWPQSGIKTAEREGVRVVYLETQSVPATIPQGTSTPSQSPTVTEQVLVTLPVRSAPVSNSSCLSSDVIGIALDGSLIRNSDYTAYRVFESITLIGYALDGFPIYGTARDIETDECGGALVGTTYRYYLSPDREGMIGCFSGVPVRI